MKELLSYTIHECCGSTEVCTHNSQEPGGHCSHCTFQLVSEREECASPHQQSGVRASRLPTYTCHSLDTILQLCSSS